MALDHLDLAGLAEQGQDVAIDLGMPAGHALQFMERLFAFQVALLGIGRPVFPVLNQFAVKALIAGVGLGVMPQPISLSTARLTVCPQIMSLRSMSRACSMIFR